MSQKMSHTFTIPTPEVFFGPLKKVMAVVNKSNPMEILKGVLVEIRPDGCILTGTDLEQTVQVRVDEIRSAGAGAGTGDGDGFAFVIFPRTIDMIHRLPDMPIKFEFDPGENVLWIRYGFSEQKHGTLPAANYPREQEIVGPSFSVVGVDWKRVAFAVDPKEVKLIFAGLYLDIIKRRIVATDNRRFVYMDIENEFPELEKISFPGVLLPVKTVNFLSSHLTGGTMTINHNGNKIKVQTDDATLYSRLIVAQFPPYEDLFINQFGGTNATTTVEIEVEGLKDAVERAGFMVKDTTWLEFYFCANSDTVEIVGQGIEGNVREVVGCVAKGNDLRIKFNWRFMLEGLKHSEADKVKFGFHGDKSPSVLRGVDDHKWTCILVPVIGV